MVELAQNSHKLGTKFFNYNRNNRIEGEEN